MPSFHSSSVSFYLAAWQSVLSCVDRVELLCPPTMHLAAMLSVSVLTACQSVALSAKTKYEKRDSEGE